MISTKKDLITTIDHQTSITKGILTNSLMIKKIGQKRLYHNNRSLHIKHKSTVLKFTNKYKKTKWAKSDLITTIDP